MNPGSPSCFPSASQGIHQPNHVFPDVVETSSETQLGLGSLLCSLSVLKDKVDQVQSLATIFLSLENHQAQPAALASMGTLIQEIIVTASSMLFNCQQQMSVPPYGHTNDDDNNSNIHHDDVHHPMVPADHGLSFSQLLMSSGVASGSNYQGILDGDQSFYNWYIDYTNSNNNNTSNTTASTTTWVDIIGLDSCRSTTTKVERKIPKKNKADQLYNPQGYDIVELDAADLLAMYSHYCHICGKGFKRDANLRMHMRSHGDEYKSPSALSNPLSKNTNKSTGSGADINNSLIIMGLPKKYSCPQQGCHWNKNHPKFQPLKSMVCVKNHYKRSHCPKLYVCKRCNKKEYSVLSDLRTHEKHCGYPKWLCSCGTTFSRKDKLMGHVSLFFGHRPVINPFGDDLSGFHKLESNHKGIMQIQFEEIS